MNRILLLLLLNCTSVTSQSHYTCPSNEDCIRDCSSTSCANMVIQAANAANLIVTCSNNYCAGIQISCPYDTRATCKITCNSNGCQNGVINYPQPQNVILDCLGDSSCTGLQLLGPDTFSGTTVDSNATIKCMASSACKSAIFDVNYVYKVNILCKLSSSSTTCGSTVIHAKYASHVSVNCNGQNDCSGLYIDAQYVTGELSLNCNGAYGCKASTAVHVEYANHFSLNCGANTQSCASVDIYPNIDNYHSTALSCAAAGCYGIKVHIYDDYVLNYFDFTATTTSVDSVSFICPTRGTSHLFYNATTQEFECDIKRCCPWLYGDIVCDNNIDHGSCTIDCVHMYGSLGCANKVIDAVNASSLNVICNSTDQSSGGCQDAVIFCPRNMVHKYGGDPYNCTVGCVDPYSCWQATIYSYDDNEMNLFCSDFLSCTYLQLYADNTTNCNIDCVANGYINEQLLLPKTFISTFTDNNFNNWHSSGSGSAAFVTNVNYCPDTGHKCVEVSARPATQSATASHSMYKSFDLRYQLNIVLHVDFAHDLYNLYAFGYAAFQYDCGAGYVTMSKYCYPRRDSCSTQNGYTIVEYGTVIHKQFSLPAKCNYNTNVVIRFYVYAHALGVQDETAFYINNFKLTAESDTFTGTCYHLNIDSQYQENLNLLCDGTAACVNSTINAQNARNVTTVMIGTQADIKGIINAQNSNVFAVSCGSRYSAHFVDACWKTVFYGNANSNVLNCEAYGCNTLNIYSAQGIMDWNVSINGCQECQNMRNSVFYWNISCGAGNIQSVFDGKTCSNSNCGCESLINSVQESYDTVNECVLEKPDILCGSDINCNVDCSNEANGCSERAITGAASTLLSVLCNESCLKTLIYCPFYNYCKIKCNSINYASVCNYTQIYVGFYQSMKIDCQYESACVHVEIYANFSQDISINCYEHNACDQTILYGVNSSMIEVNCYDAYSCNNLVLYGNNSNEININCFKNYSCNNIVLYAQNISNLSLNCLTNSACNYLLLYVQHSSIANVRCLSYNSNNEPACNHLSLYGSYISSYINWQCFGDYACSHNEIHGDNANTVNILAFGDRALYYGHIFAAHSNAYNLTCVSNEVTMYTCFSSTMQAPAKDTAYPYDRNAYLNCFGAGCFSLNLDTDSGFDDWIIYFNGCGLCKNITTCFDYWYLTCSDLVTLDDHWKLNYYYGDSCKYMSSDDCKCVSYINILDAAFINSYVDDKEFCNFQIPSQSMTYSPTTIPTDIPSNAPSHYPSNLPTNNPSKYPTNSPIMAPTNDPTATPTQSPNNPTLTASASPTESFITYNPTLSDHASPSSISTFPPNSVSKTTETTMITRDNIIHTTNNQKADSQSKDSFVAILEAYYVFILIGVGVFICCVFACCGVLICLYCRKDKQFKKVLEHQANLTQDFEATQRNIELMHVKPTTHGSASSAKTDKLQFATLSESTYENF